MSFADMIESSQELLQRRVTTHPKDDLSWDLHVRKFEQYLDAEEKWTLRKVVLEPPVRSILTGQTILAKDLEAKNAVKSLWWDLCALPQVESVSMLRLSDDVFSVTTIITDFNLEVERKIAQVEVELLRKYQDLRFDFMIVPKRNRPLSDLRPRGSEILYSKKRD